MHQQLMHRFVLAGAILLCFRSAGVACAQTASQAKGPDFQQALDFFGNGLAQNLLDTRGGREGRWSSSMAYRKDVAVTQVELAVKAVKTTRECVFADISVVHLSDLDPDSVRAVDQDGGVFLSVGTTDGRRVAIEDHFSEKRNETNCLVDPSQKTNVLLFRFGDAAYRDRALKAVRRAIELAGGKPSAF